MEAYYHRKVWSIETALWDEKDTRRSLWGVSYVERQRQASASNAVSGMSAQHCPLLVSYSDLGYPGNLLLHLLLNPMPSAFEEAISQINGCSPIVLDQDLHQPSVVSLLVSHEGRSGFDRVCRSI